MAIISAGKRQQIHQSLRGKAEIIDKLGKSLSETLEASFFEMTVDEDGVIAAKDCRKLINQSP